MFSVSQSITINCPAEKVFAFISNPKRIPEWRDDVLEVTAPSTIAVGTEFIEMINFMGKKPFTMKILELEPNRKEVIENIAGPGVRPIQTFELTSDGNTTVFTVSVTMRTYGFFKLMEPMLPGMIMKNWSKYLENLKSALETSAS